MIVVSDTTPLISFLKIGRMELLERLFGRVLIPQAVYDELTIDMRFEQEARQIEKSNFIEVKLVKNPESVSILKRATGLDQGESEAIVLAYERKELTSKEARECIDVLQNAGRHISQKYYQMLLNMLSE